MVTPGLLSEWADVWSEYREVYQRWELADEREAFSVTIAAARCMPRPDLDRVADALQEYAIRAGERGVADDRLRSDLREVRLDTVWGLFGTAAEDVGPLALGVLVGRLAVPSREGVAR